jgi:F-type H+-transporting ATPase subunit b
MFEFLSVDKNWVLISFVIFLYIFYKYAYSFIVEKLDSKINEIKTELETVETLRIEAQELLAQYQRKHRDAVLEAEEIIKHAQKQANSMKDQAVLEIEQIKARREKQLEERLSRIEQETIQEIQAYVVSASVKTSEKIIEDFSTKNSSQDMVSKSISNTQTHLSN